MLKKLISTILSVSIILSACNLPTFAWAPTDYDDPTCIDLSKLGNGKDYISLPEESGKKVCGCKKCTVDAVMYNRFEDYIKDLEKRFDFIASKENYLENKIQLENICIALKQLIRDIENRRYKNNNFILFSSCYDYHAQDLSIKFSNKNGVPCDINKYDENYFNKINSEMIKPLVCKFEKILEFKKNSPIDYNRDNNKIFFRAAVSSLLAVTTLVYSADIIISAKNKYKAKKHTAKLSKLISLLPKMTKAQKNTCLEKMNEYLEDSAELTEENLEKLPTEAIDELLKDIEK